MIKSNSSTLIELKNAGVKRAGKWLARGITFSLHAGEVVTLIGPNGTAETTSKMALGLLDLTRCSAKSRFRVTVNTQKVSIDWTLPQKISTGSESDRLLLRDRN